MADDAASFLVARNPDPDSSLRYLLRLPLEGGILLKARDCWPPPPASTATRSTSGHQTRRSSKLSPSGTASGAEPLGRFELALVLGQRHVEAGDESLPGG